jgi:hypothetical protein
MLEAAAGKAVNPAATTAEFLRKVRRSGGLIRKNFETGGLVWHPIGATK